jgi:RNA polymerase sigma factor (sigma-70 family)
VNVDGDALWSLWGPTYGLVRVLAPYLSDESVEDIVGDAFLRVLRADRELDDRDDACRRYLFMVARNLVIDRSRHDGCVQMVGIEAAEWTRGTVDAGSERHVALMDLRAALPSIAETHRRFAEMQAEGFIGREIAAAFGTTWCTVRSRNWKTYRALRGLLEVPA